MTTLGMSTTQHNTTHHTTPHHPTPHHTTPHHTTPHHTPALPKQLSRRKPLRLIALLASAFLVAPLATRAQDPSQQPRGCPANPTQGGAPYVCVTTYLYSPWRVGLNVNETQVAENSSGAFPNNFGYLTTFTGFDDAIYAQPLYLPGVYTTSNSNADSNCSQADGCNLLYVATENNTVYAVDADTGTTAWSVNLTRSGGTPENEPVDFNLCTNITGNDGSTNVGITGTPVIDISGNQAANTITAGTLYVVTASVVPSSGQDCSTSPLGCYFYQDLYALDVTTGSILASTVAAGGIAGTSGTVSFSARTSNQRGALLLQGSSVYIPFGSHCDNGGWAGWLISYGLSGSTLTQKGAWLATAKTGLKAGLWASGGGASSDGSNIYVAMGNGQNNVPTSTSGQKDASCAAPCDYGDSVVQLSSSLAVNDYFTPYDRALRINNGHDWDLGSGEVMVLPSQTGGNPTGVAIQGGKEGNLYLMNRATGYMGGFSGSTGTCPNGVDDNLQSIYGCAQLNEGLCYAYTATPHECGMWSSPAWWNAGNALSSSAYPSYFYVVPYGGPILQYTLCLAQIAGTACSNFPGTNYFTQGNKSTDNTNFKFPGITPVVTSSAPTSAYGILWALDDSPYGSNPNYAILYAYDAGALGTYKWTSSSQTVQAPQANQFVVPVIANGRAFVAGVKRVGVYACMSAGQAAPCSY